MNSRLRFALAGFFALTFLPLEAQVSTWILSNSTGSWNDPNNWNPIGVPTGTTIAIFDNGTFAANVILPASSTPVEDIEVFDTTATFTGIPTTSFSIASELFIFDSGTVTMSLTSGNTVSIGEGLGVGGGEGNGEFTLSGDGSLTVTAQLFPSEVGVGGPGTLNQTGGTLAVTGSLVVGGDGAVFDEFGSSTAGTGTFNLSGTSTFTFDTLLLGAGSSASAGQSTGVLNMTGGTVSGTTISLGVSSSATGTVNGDTGIVGQSAGSVTVTHLNVGESDGGIGSYTLSGSSTLTATNLNIGDKAGSSGTFTQSGASTASFTTVTIGNAAGSTGNFSQSGGTDTVTTLTVGNGGTGSYTLSGGNLTVLTGGGVTIGSMATSSGMFSQSNGTLTTNGTVNVVVGGSGSGGYSLSGGELMVGGAVNVGTGSGSGTFTLSGTGEVDAAHGIFVGGTNTGGSTGTGVFNYSGGTIGATSTVTVNANGTFNQNAGSFTPVTNEIVLSAAGATYNLNSGTLTIGGNMTGSSGIKAATGAIFNFAGGAVAVTGTTWVDSLAGSITNNSTINTAGGNATLSGVLSGGGTLTLTGGGNLNLTSDNHTQSWGVDIMQGTVNVMASQFPTMGNVMFLASTGTFNVTTAGTNTLSGSFSGPGTLTVNFSSGTDTLDLSGAVSLTGTATLVGGGTTATLEAGNGSFNDIGGSGQFVVGGATPGLVTITGAATYSGLTTVNPGFTLDAASIANSVNNNGTLGVYSGGAPTGTLTIGGTLDSTGNLVVRVVGGQADYFDITGAGTTTVDNVVLGAGSAPGTGTFTILHTAMSGDLAPFTTEQISANRFISLTVETSTMTMNQDLELISSSVPTTAIAGLVLTPNEASVAAVLNPLIVAGNQPTAFYKLLNLIGPNSASNAQLALNLEQLTPESLQYGPTIAYENATFMVQNLNNFETNIHHNFDGFDTSGIGVFLPGFDSGLGHELQGMLASFHDTAPNGVNYYPEGDGSISDEAPSPSPSSPEPSHQVISDSAPIPMRTAAQEVHLRDPSNHFTEFAGGDITLADLNQSQGAANAPSTTANYTSANAIAGVGYRITSNLTAGILMDYNHTDATTDGYGSKTRVDSYAPGVWATYGEKGFFANGMFSYGINSYSNQRVIPALSETASSGPSGGQYVGDLDLGYEFHPAYNWTLAPTLGVTYTHLDVDSYNETGAYPADLSVNAQHDDSFRSRLGGYVTYLTHPGMFTLQPTFTAMWQHEYLDQSTQLTSQFNDFPAGAFTINSVTVGRDSALVGGGLTATLDNSLAFFINATADIGSNYTAENVVGGIKGTF